MAGWAATPMHTSTANTPAAESASNESGDVSQTAPDCPANPAAPLLKGPSEAGANLGLAVLGLPAEGARTRVETQIWISLVLVHLRPHASVSNLVTGTGTLAPDAGSLASRVGAFPYLRLPKWAALKRKHKRIQRPDASPELCLFLDASVVSASASSPQELRMCDACVVREQKREARKFSVQSRPNLYAASSSSDEPQSDMPSRRIVVFNCGQYLDFSEGRVEFPMRLTCYCRHQKEPLGFKVIFTARDGSGNVVATAETPPILTTDDHKSRSVMGGKASQPDEGSKTLKSQSNVNNCLDIAAVDAKLSKVDRSPFSTPPLSTRVSPSGSPASSALSLSNSSSHPGAVRSKHHPSKDSSYRAKKPYEPSCSRIRNRSNAPFSPSAMTMTPLNKNYKNDRHLPQAPSFPKTDPSTPAFPGATIPGFALGWKVDDASSKPTLGFTGRWDATAPPPFPDLNSHTSPFEFASPLSLSNGDNRTEQHSNEDASPTSPENSAESLFSFVNDGISSDGHSPSMWDTSINHYNKNSVPDNSVEAASSNNPFSSDMSSISLPKIEMSDSRDPSFTPTIARVIPCEGPTHGGIEVTIVGNNFVPGLAVAFGESLATETKHWSSSTIICTLPPSATPGPVVVSFSGESASKNVTDAFSQTDMLMSSPTLQFFTYKDNSDRAIMELALRIVGMKMSGKVEDAKDVAVRLIGSAYNSQDGTNSSISNLPTDKAADLASTLQSASDSMTFRINRSTPPSPTLTPKCSSQASENAQALPTQARGFEGTILRFLSLLDLDLSGVVENPDSVNVPISECISLRNQHGQTLLHLSALLGFHRLTHWLLSHDVDFDCADVNGYTALHFAAVSGRLFIARQLIDCGASLSLRTKSNQTAHDLAKSYDQVDVAALFSSLPCQDSIESSSPALLSRQRSEASFVRVPSVLSLEADPRWTSFSNDADDDIDGGECEEDADSFSDSDVESRISRQASYVSIATMPLSVLERSHEIPTGGNTVDDSTLNASTSGSPSTSLQHSNATQPNQPRRPRNWGETFSSVSDQLKDQTWILRTMPTSMPTLVPSAISGYFLNDPRQERSSTCDTNGSHSLSSMRRVGFQDLKVRNAIDKTRWTQYYSYRGRRPGRDRMLYLFWIPVLVCALAYAVYCTLPLLRPFIAASTPQISPLPWIANSI